MDSAKVTFYVICQINEQDKEIKVIQLETTDGVPYYSCMIGDNEITQLRNEIYGKWEQLWGDLDNETIQQLGKQIEEKITPP